MGGLGHLSTYRRLQLCWVRRVSNEEWLARGQNESPRSRTLGQADEPPSTCAPPRRHDDTRYGGRIYHWTDCWRIAFHVWKQAIHTNGSRRRQDSFSFLVERFCKHRTAVAQGRKYPNSPILTPFRRKPPFTSRGFFLPFADATTYFARLSATPCTDRRDSKTVVKTSS